MSSDLSNKVREYRRCNQKWIIQRNWQRRVHKTNKNKIKIQHTIRKQVKTNRHFTSNVNCVAKN